MTDRIELINLTLTDVETGRMVGVGLGHEIGQVKGEIIGVIDYVTCRETNRMTDAIDIHVTGRMAGVGSGHVKGRML